MMEDCEDEVKRAMKSTMVGATYILRLLLHLMPSRLLELVSAPTFHELKLMTSPT